MIMTFLPDDYKPPAASGGNYTKLVQGKNNLRIIGAAITGWLGWTRKEVDGEEKAAPVRTKDKPANGTYEETPKHIWACPVWNHDLGCIQIWEIPQASIREQLLEFVNDSDWGDPKQYDVCVQRNGEGLLTTYTTVPKPPTTLSEAALSEIREKLPLINLEALYTGDDPFAAMAPQTNDDDPFGTTP